MSESPINERRFTDREVGETLKPGFRWPVAVARVIDRPQANVWEAISAPGNLELCHPYCERNPVQVWPGDASIDEVHYLSGWVFERRFLRWIEGVGYDLDIGRPGGPTSFVSWRIFPAGAHRSILRISIYPYLLQRLPVPIRWFPHRWHVHPMLARYLSAVTGGFEWYVTRGEAVPRDHFGSHPWFSARSN